MNLLSIILAVYLLLCHCAQATQLEVVKGTFTPLSAWEGKALLRASALPLSLPLYELSCLEPCWDRACPAVV